MVIKGEVTDALADNENSDILHAWDMVKIDGKPYYVDLTWDIISSDRNIPRHDYFNLTDNNMSIKHIVEQGYPACTTKNNNFFVKNDLIATNKQKLLKIVAEKIKSGKNFVEVKLDSQFFNENSDSFSIVDNYLRSLTNGTRHYSLRGTEPSKQSVCDYEWKFK